MSSFHPSLLPILWVLDVNLCVNHKPLFFHCRLCAVCIAGHSRSDLFYVSSVLKVTQPVVCSKTHCLKFSPSSLHNTLSPFFSLRETWQHGTISEPFVGLCHMMHTEDAHWTFGRPPSPTQAFHSDPRLSSSVVI